MTTKTITLRSIDLIQGMGSDGVPFRWLESMVSKVRALVPDDEEGTCKVHGAANLTFAYEHTLSPQEELEDLLGALTSAVDGVKALLPRKGEPMTAEQVDALRELLG
jgi:hypothetical protein